MLTDNEEKFIKWWEENRLKEKKFYFKLSYGLPLGILMVVAIVFALTSGWFLRANMVASNKLNPYVFTIALLAIIIFISVIYNQFRWERNEQHYLELKNKKEKSSAK